MHPTIHISVGDQSADIDEKIAPIIEALWDKGIHTLFSCQDYGESGGPKSKRGWMYIQFSTTELVRFLDLIQIPTDQWDPSIPLYTIHPWPFAIWEWEMYPVWNTDAQTTKLITTAIFPEKDAPYLLSRINREKY